MATIIKITAVVMLIALQLTCVLALTRDVQSRELIGICLGVIFGWMTGAPFLLMILAAGRALP